MKTRTLITGLAFSTALLLAPSAMAVNASPYSGTGGSGTGGIALAPTHLGGGGAGGIALAPTHLGGGTGQARYEQDQTRLGDAGSNTVRSNPADNDDLASNNDGSLVEILTLRYIPSGYKWLGFVLR